LLAVILLLPFSARTISTAAPPTAAAARAQNAGNSVYIAAAMLTDTQYNPPISDHPISDHICQTPLSLCRDSVGTGKILEPSI
jgi:hypothetical protein